MIHLAFNALNYGIYLILLEVQTKLASVFSMIFPDYGGGEATGQCNQGISIERPWCNMSATADFLPLPLIQDEQVVSYWQKKGT